MEAQNVDCSCREVEHERKKREGRQRRRAGRTNACSRTRGPKAFAYIVGKVVVKAEEA